MTLDELKAQVEKDLTINDERLDTESLRNQELYSKYLYYGGKSDAKIYVTKPFDLKVLKTDLHVYIESDEDIIKSEHKVAYLESVIKYIDGILKSITNRQWDIKNAISWRQFEAGMV